MLVSSIDCLVMIIACGFLQVSGWKCGWKNRYTFIQLYLMIIYGLWFLLTKFKKIKETVILQEVQLWCKVMWIVFLCHNFATFERLQWIFVNVFLLNLLWQKNLVVIWKIMKNSELWSLWIQFTNYTLMYRCYSNSLLLSFIIKPLPLYHPKYCSTCSCCNIPRATRCLRNSMLDKCCNPHEHEFNIIFILFAKFIE